jgi:hypothetical protein
MARDRHHSMVLALLLLALLLRLPNLNESLWYD